MTPEMSSAHIIFFKNTMSMLPSKLPNVSTTIFSIMSKMAAAYNAINLSQGFPDFESDPNLIELVAKAMKDGHNQYAPMPGDVQLRERISEKIQQLHGKHYHLSLIHI